MTVRAKIVGICLLALSTVVLCALPFTADAAPARAAKKSAAKNAGQPAAVRQAPAPASQAAEGEQPQSEETKVLVLPFQINAGPEMERLNDELPSLINQRILSRNVAVVPGSQVAALLRSEKVAALDVQTVRRLARKVGASAALYGSFSQVGEAFSIDARFVDAGGENTKVLFVERASSIELLPAVDELVTRVVNEVNRRHMVAGVEVRGTRVLDSDVVLMRINTRKGDAVDTEAIDREVKRIWDLGYFSDVSVTVEERTEGLFLVYTVQEKPRIESIVIEGAKDVSDSDILSVMSTKTGSILNDKLLVEDLQKIIELFRKEGYYLATVNHHVDSRQGGSAAALVLTVAEGNKLYITKVKIEGSSQLDEGDVKDELVLSERNMLSWLTGSGVLKEELLDRDAAAIGAYYMNSGFIDVEVGAPKVDYAEDGITITFVVKEGQRYRLGQIHFAGDLIDTDERLRSVTKLNAVAADNGYFGLNLMQDDTQRLTDFYAEYGYAFADINPMPTKVEGETGLVDITFKIDKKQKVYIRRALIVGNTRTRDNVILRELRLTDGDMFVGSRLRRSTQRLNKLGFFETAEAELVPTQNEEEVDLKIAVKEKSTGALMAGFGYSTYSSFGVSGTLQERNLWGKGYIASLNASTSSRRTAYTLSFTNPRYNDSNLSVGFDLYNWRDDFIDYRKKTTGGLARFAYPLGEYSSVGWGYRLDKYRLYDIDDDASNLIRRYEGDRTSSVLFTRLTRDTTDAEIPTTGTINRVGIEYGGGVIGGDDSFIRTTAEHQTFYQLRQHHVLHMRLKGGAIFTNDEPEVPVFERFWMGGMESVRGYNSKDIVPRDPETNDRLGGTRMAFGNFEYIWTMSPAAGLSLVPFFDVGFNIDHQESYKWDDEIKRSAGLELRWRSPMGDLRFAYGVPFDEDRKGNRDSGRFEFSMGQFF